MEEIPGHSSEQQERPGSPVASCASMKSGWSMDFPLKFNDEDPSPEHSPIQQKSPDSTGASCLSMKSDWSMDFPLKFKGPDPSSGHSQILEKASDLTISSCVSEKSHQSVKSTEVFREEETSYGCSSEQQERAGSPTASCASMKSDWSMDFLLKFTDEDPSPEHSQILEKTSDLTISSCVSEESHQSMKCMEVFREEETSYECRSDQSSAETKYCENFKCNLKKKFQCLHEVITNQENQKLLNEIYTELYITEGGSGEINKEHEVRQMEAASRRTSTEETPITCNDLFTPLSEQDKPIRTVLTTGVAGIGKTVSVQKFILDWSEEKANQDLHFIFPLPFRELNLMKDQKLSLMDLLHECFKETKEMEISSSHKALFIFDGLDESRLTLDFQNGVNLCDVTESASVEVLLMNLMKGNLLPSALIWITSRPAAADQIPSECVDRVTEVRGFSDPQKEEYFRKRISDQSLADRTIKHLKTSRSLYIMCQIPVFCWISATVLEKILNEAENREIPKTLTEMYTHFIIIQTQIIREKYQENQQHTDEEMLLKLGQLAFQQLIKGNLIFYDEDLRECGIDIREALLYSGVCTQIFREESELLHSKVYCFVHLSIQEHLAALYVHLTFINQKKNVLKQKHSSKLRILKRTEDTLSDIHKSAIDQALQSQNGHLDLFVRFLLGLSLDSNQTLIQHFLTQTECSSHNKEETVQYIQKKIKENSSAEKSINLFHCLNELDDNSVVEQVQQYLESGDLQSCKLSPSQWSAVVFVLLTTSQKMEVFDMHEYNKSGYGSGVVFQKLLPVVAASRTAHLTDTNLNKKSCAALASIICSESSSVRELHLSKNPLGDSGVKLISAGLKNPLCKVESLWMVDCNISNEGCAALASALKSNPSHLIVLELSRNNLGNSGIKLLSGGLENPLCILKILWLRYCNITDEGCAALASALKSNPSHLKELHLSGNKLGDSGVKLLSAGLGNPLCTVEILWLKYCDITDEGCAALAAARKSNPSHLKELDLTGNAQIRTGYELLFAFNHYNVPVLTSYY